MYVRRNTKKRADGTTRVEVMLAHNVRVLNVSGKSVSKPVILARLGNEDDLDLDFVDAAIKALERYRKRRAAELAAQGKSETTMEEAVALQEHTRPTVARLRVLASRQLGVRLVVERVWKELGLEAVFKQLEEQSCRTVPLERVVFSMVVNRLVDPLSKLSCNDWVCRHAHFPEAEDWSVDHFYRALDVIEANLEHIGAHVAERVLAAAPEDEREALLMDTTAIFTEAAMDDAQRAEIAAWWDAHRAGKRPKPPCPRPQVVNDPPLRMRGKSKDNRPDAPQVVVGLTATRSGMPVCHSIFPGNTNDRAVTRSLVEEAMKRHPGREVVWAMDGGMAGGPNLSWLAAHPGRLGWVCAVPKRRSAMVAALLRRPGRWANLGKDTPAGPWTYRKVQIAEPDRINAERPEVLLAIRNPTRARRDLQKLDRDIERIQAALAKDDTPPARGVKGRTLSAPSRSRLTKVGPNKRLMLDKEAIKRERRLAGVKVVRTTMTAASAPEVSSAYTALLRIEDDFRTFKSPLRVRPMHHRSSHRIAAHVMMCFLALVCQRHIEAAAGQTWKQLRKGLEELHAVKMEHGQDTWWQHSELSPEAETALEACGVEKIEPRWVASGMPRVMWRG